MTSSVVAAPANTLTVSGLTNGQTYTVRVTARNAVGSGPASAPATGTPAGSGTGTFARPFAADSLWYRPVSASGIAVGSWTNPGITINSDGVDGEVEFIVDGRPAAGVNQRTMRLTGIWNGGGRAHGGSPYGGSAVWLPDDLIIPDTGSTPGDSVPAGYLTPSGSTPNNDGGFLTHDGATWISPQVIARPFTAGDIWAGWNMEEIPMASRGTYGGRNASQLSAVGGSIRPGELEATPPSAGALGPSGTCTVNHAIKFVAPMWKYGRRTVGLNGGGGYCTPSRAQDSGWNQSGSGNYYNGNSFWMGSLIAIRPADYAAARAAMTTNQGRNLVDCLTTYGGYICENSGGWDGSTGTWEHWGICVDVHASASGINSGGSIEADFINAIQRCYVVVGNNPAL